jgi:hypothetical protein
MSTAAQPAAQVLRPDFWDEACKHLMKKDRVMKRLIPQFGEASLQSRGDVGEFLAERGGTCGLSVGAREHRQRGVRMRHRAQRVDDRVERRQQHGVQVPQHRLEALWVFRRGGRQRRQHVAGSGLRLHGHRGDARAVVGDPIDDARAQSSEFLG